MGYTHYYKASGFHWKQFYDTVKDFQRMVPVLEHLGVRLRGPDGRGEPVISAGSIAFNGDKKCGHTRRELGIVWPAGGASGVAKNTILTGLETITRSEWYAGAELLSRACGGDCSYESFVMEPVGTGDKEYIDITEDRRHYTPYVHKEMEFKGFCKTAYKPYDLAVNVCLVIARKHMDASICSDGDITNWQEAMQICQHFLGYGSDFTLDR